MFVQAVSLEFKQTQGFTSCWTDTIVNC